MRKKDQKELPPMLERYELKFTIPLEMIAPISEFVSVYCSPDKYSLQTENGFYKVNNLYLDSPGFRFLQMRISGVQNRFNMRIRSYGDSSILPYFLEIKQKLSDVVRKYRARVTNPEWYKSYTQPGFEPEENNSDPIEIKNRNLFERLIYSYSASPKVLTQYVRNAWISDVDSYARVTFDMDLRYKPESDYNLEHGEREMTPCDNMTVFDPGCSVILELKCYTTRVPLWMIDLIKYFNLHRRSFSKYMVGATEAFGCYGYSQAETVSTVRF